MTHRITDTADANGRANSLVGIAGSNSTGGMDVCLLWMLCVTQVKDSAMGRSLVQGVLPCVYVCVIECDQLQKSPSKR